MNPKSFFEKQLRRLELEARQDYLLNKIKNIRRHQGDLVLHTIRLKDKIEALTFRKEIIESRLNTSKQVLALEAENSRPSATGSKIMEIKENISRIYNKNQELKTEVEELQKSMVYGKNTFPR